MALNSIGMMSEGPKTFNFLVFLFNLAFYGTVDLIFSNKQT